MLLTGWLPAQPGGCFEDAFNHGNWKPLLNPPVPYTHSVTPTQWANADNDPGQGNIRAMHLCLIPPTAPLPGEPFGLGGRVLVWDGNELEDPDGTQFWSIMDPVRSLYDDDKFWNFELSWPQLPKFEGRPTDFGCAGHSWTADGKLLVFSGTSQVINPPPPGVPQTYPVSILIKGTKHAFEFDPTNSPGNTMWTKLLDMAYERWYPSTTQTWDAEPQTTQDERIVVTGGRDEAVTPNLADNYEAFEPGPDVWRSWLDQGVPNLIFQGPSHLGNDPWPPVSVFHYLHLYPRLHLMSDGDVYRSGMTQHSAVFHHLDTTTTTDTAWTAR